MNGFWQTASPYFWRPEVPYVFGMTVLLGAVLLRFLPAERRAVLNTVGFFVLCLAGQFGAALLHAAGLATGAATVHEAFLLGSGIALIRLGGLFTFRVALRAVRLEPPRILEDILVILAYIGWGLVRLRLAGLDLSGIVATSAVITAVIAFSMQETLGNILGGLALQLDSSIEIGDWIRLDDVSGRVLDIRWRYTAVETRNGETVVLPNSLLMKSKFALVGRSGRARSRWRRWIWFNVDYAAQPAQVIDTVEKALAGAEIPNVASEPAPNCLLMEFGPNYGRYALRYWLTDPLPDDPTDSAVRRHVLAALQRAGFRLALPEQSMHVVSEDEAHREAVRLRELERRLDALRHVELFAGFSAEEMRALAERLVYAPFVRGDAITRQGMIAHWLYVLVSGEVEVWYESEARPRRLLTRLSAGNVFGEMGMLTGEPRRATVTARTDVECYRLDKLGFTDIIRSRPAIADELSAVLAEREAELEHLRSEIRSEVQAHEVSRQHASILGRMREFFGLSQ